MTNIVLKTYDYLEEIKNSNLYKEYKKLFHEIDTLYENEIKEFNNYKEKYYEVIQYGKYHPDYKETLINFSKAKQNLYTLEKVARYLKLEKEIEKEINTFFREVSESISNHIPIPNALGMINKGGACSVS